MSTLRKFFFISFSHESAEDAQFALRLAKDLRAYAVNVWIDHPALHFGEPVQRVLEGSPGMLVILSPDAVKSERVRRELSFARAHGKWIEGVLFRDCELTGVFDFRQAFDFRRDYDSAFKTLREHLGESSGAGGRGPEAGEEYEVEEAAPEAYEWPLTAEEEQEQQQQQQQQQQQRSSCSRLPS